ncbi:AraC-like ligand-binding domain-containing protein [Amycolatopsis aidingensis]|uniref:AraC-like ligand-binding domain-containing protein n=1 Tax=Amycolatopsis aidingensis TaxID=2842453 RepID=UPI001C0BA6A4|nr:helix-turn-helix domain-containing protein [Amycolatopsis aidingensis]
MTILVRTSDVPARERTELWRAAASEAYVPLEMRLDDAESFRGQIAGQVFGELRVGEVTADAHRAHRPGRLIGRQDDLPPHYKLSMPVRGYCLVQQDGREASLTPGDLAIYDTSRPYTVVFEDTCQMLTLMFPRRNLHLPAEQLERVTASRVSGRHSVGALLGPLLLNLVSRMDEIDAAQALRLADNVVDMVATTFAGQLGEDTTRRPPGHRSLVLRAKSFIEAHLEDTDLTPGMVAAAMHISTGYLHKLFRRENTTVSRWIRERRLEHCRRDLRDPDQSDLAVSSVAAHWGFIDAAHFSRLFKAAYGLPPREYRIVSEGGTDIHLSATGSP